jgi:hypothetical protein
VDVVTLTLKMTSPVVFIAHMSQVWAIVAPVKVATAETRRRRVFLRRWLQSLGLLRWRVLATLSTFLGWFLHVVEVDIIIGGNLTIGLCGYDVHAVGNDVIKAYLVSTLVEFLMNSGSQGIVSRCFKRGEENECSELFLRQVLKPEPFQGRFASDS